MSFSSIASMLSAAQESGQPLYAVIRDADCQENGYDAAASYRQIAKALYLCWVINKISFKKSRIQITYR